MYAKGSRRRSQEEEPWTAHRMRRGSVLQHRSGLTLPATLGAQAEEIRDLDPVPRTQPVAHGKPRSRSDEQGEQGEHHRTLHLVGTDTSAGAQREAAPSRTRPDDLTKQNCPLPTWARSGCPDGAVTRHNAGFRGQNASRKWAAAGRRGSPPHPQPARWAGRGSTSINLELEADPFAAGGERVQDGHCFGVLQLHGAKVVVLIDVVAQVEANLLVVKVDGRNMHQRHRLPPCADVFPVGHPTVPRLALLAPSDVPGHVEATQPSGSSGDENETASPNKPSGWGAASRPGAQPCPAQGERAHVMPGYPFPNACVVSGPPPTTIGG
jgi:hypothetical protein